MDENEKVLILERWKREHLFRHGQRGYFLLDDLPQRPVLQSVFGTGWWELDQILQFYPGQFVVVTGVAGHGKSTLLLNIVCNLLKHHGVSSFLYVPENESNLIENLRTIWNHDETFLQLRQSCFIQSSSHSGEDNPQTLRWVLENAIVAVERDGAKIVLIDPWNELDRAKPRDMLMTDYIGECLMMLKDFCRRFNVTVIVVAHPTKAVAEKGGRAATLADIEGSMNWFNKCDNGLVVIRDLENNAARVISAKVRERGAGKIGVCHFHVDPETGIFTPQYGAVTP